MNESSQSLSSPPLSFRSIPNDNDDDDDDDDGARVSQRCFFLIPLRLTKRTEILNNKLKMKWKKWTSREDKINCSKSTFYPLVIFQFSKLFSSS